MLEKSKFYLITNVILLLIDLMVLVRSRRIPRDLTAQNETGIPFPIDGKPPPVAAEVKVTEGPYDFDGTICVTVDGRIQCGYNKNIGLPESELKIVARSNGCRHRSGRIECGYGEAHIEETQRRASQDLNKREWDLDKQKKSNENEIDGTPSADYNLIDATILRIFQPLTEKADAVTEAVRTFTRCIEVSDRIVCNSVKA